MASRTAVKRLNTEYKSLQQAPTPFVDTHPSDDNILEWPYVITGPPDTPFAGGKYMGILTFPPNYPFAPPRIKMVTPSGRFEPNSRLCLTMSDYHPETWNPAWNVSTILTALLSFMCSDEHATGALNTSDTTKRKYASRAMAWNVTNDYFKRQFPELVQEHEDAIKSQGSISAAVESQNRQTSANSISVDRTSTSVNRGNIETDGASGKESKEGSSHGTPRVPAADVRASSGGLGGNGWLVAATAGIVIVAVVLFSH